MIKQGFSNLNEISRRFEVPSAVKFQTMEDSMIPKVNARLLKAVITNSHPHRMAAKVLRKILKNVINKENLMP